MIKRGLLLFRAAQDPGEFTMKQQQSMIFAVQSNILEPLRMQPLGMDSKKDNFPTKEIKKAHNIILK